MKRPQITASTRAVPTAWRTFPVSLAPICLAMTTFAPIDRPTKKLTRRETTGAFPPTAAIASLLANLPTTATSVALKSCWSMLVRARGMAKKRTLSRIDPFVRSFLSEEPVRLFLILLVSCPFSPDPVIFLYCLYCCILCSSPVAGFFEFSVCEEAQSGPDYYESQYLDSVYRFFEKEYSQKQ